MHVYDAQHNFKNSLFKVMSNMNSNFFLILKFPTSRWSAERWSMDLIGGWQIGGRWSVGWLVGGLW